MSNDSGRILALEARLDDVERVLLAYDFLLRSLLTHLALADPGQFESLIGAFRKAGLYRAQGSGVELTGEVARDLTAMLDEIVREVDRRR